MPISIVIVDYDPDWQARFEAEKKVIFDALGGSLVALEHIGSTSVAGLGAKPIIDMLAGIRQLADAVACIPTLQRLGYEYVPQFEAEFPERRFFRRGAPDARTYHLHMVEVGSDFWERHLLFRDYLRSYPEIAQDYEVLKRRLADLYGADRESYTKAKTDFIVSSLAQARNAATGIRGQ